MQTRSTHALAAALVLVGLGCQQKLLGISGSIAVAPDNLAFGQVPVGGRPLLQVSVSNTGSASLTVSRIAVGSDPRNELAVSELLATDCHDQPRLAGTALAPGACARFTVGWTPLYPHPLSGTIEIDSDDPDHGLVTLPVTGTAVGPLLQYCVLAGDGTVDPAACSSLGATPPVTPAIDLGTGTLGAETTRTVRLTNQGPLPLLFAPAPALSPGTAPSFFLAGAVPGNSLAPAASADLTVTATPSATGSLSGALLLDSNDAFVPRVSIPLQIAVAAFPIISVTPAALAFGSTELGTPQQLQVSVSNLGSAPLLLSAIKVASDPNSELSLDDLLTTDCHNASRTGGMTLAPGECARFTVAWSPSSIHAAAGAIELDSNDAATPVVLLPVSGSTFAPLLQVCILARNGAVVPSQCSDLGATPHTIPAVDFGTVAPDAPTTIKVRLINQGNAPLNFSPAPALLATGAPAFSLSGTVPGNALAAGAHADLTVTANATVAGALTSALNLASDDPRAPVVAVPIQASVPGWQLCVSAASLDFGPVTLGQSLTRSVTLTNCGGVGLAVDAFALNTVAPTSGQFVISSGALPPLGSSIGVGAVITLGITYKPTAVQSDAASMDWLLAVGGATLPVTVGLKGQGTQSTCGTTGRPNPVANIAASYSTDQSGTGVYTPFNPYTTQVIPLDWIKLNGSGSTVSSGAPSYTWTLLSQPAGSNVVLTAPTSPAITMHTLVSGIYVAQLVVKDSTGCVSAASAVTIRVVPQGAVHIELTWAEGCGDLDLHYVAPGAAMCDGNDIFYADLPAQYHGPGFPDWGCANDSCNGAPSAPGGPHPDHTSSDDGTLDVDNVTGFGPENITQPAPFDSPAGAPYQVWVFYYSDHTGSFDYPACGRTTPTVHVYVNGAVAASYSLPASSFANQELWHAADISVSGGGTRIAVTQPPGSPQLSFDQNRVCACEFPGDHGSPSCF